jgi:hypothetical protein
VGFAWRPTGFQVHLPIYGVDVGRQIAVIQEAMRLSMNEAAAVDASINEMSSVSGSLTGMVTKQASATANRQKARTAPP